MHTLWHAFYSAIGYQAGLLVFRLLPFLLLVLALYGFRAAWRRHRSGGSR